MRLFLALSIEPERAAALFAALAPYRARAPHARWVPAENYHVTLKFIGEWPPEREAALSQAVAAAAAAPLEVRLVGLGAFPNARRPRQLWVGIADPAPVAALAAAIENACVGLGIARDARPFTPHLTLAHARGGELAPLGSALAPDRPEWGSERVGAFDLYYSRTLPAGPVYSRRASFPLRAAAGR